MGFLLGPVIGGFAASWGNTAPAYLAAAVTLITMLWGLFMLPESLHPDQRTKQVRAAALNPFTQLRAILALPQLRWLIVAGFCYSFPFAGLLATFGVFLIGQFGWTAGQLGLTSLMVGVMDMLVQGVLVARLLPRLGEVKLAIVGLIGVLAGYLLIGAVAIVPSLALLLLGIAFFAGCGGLVEPALGSLLSRAAGSRAQGAVQGGSQAIQSLAMIIAPLWSGWIFSRFGPATPFWSGGIWIGLAILAILFASPVLRAAMAAGGDTQPGEA